MYKVRQSMLNTYKQCPFMCLNEWGKFGEKEPYDTDEHPTNKYALTGIAFHETMEYWGNEKMRGVSLDLLNLHDDLTANFNKIPIDMFEDNLDKEEFFNSLHEQLDWVYENHLNIVPLAVELKFELEGLILGLPNCAGTIDRIQGDMTAQDVDLVDYKTGKVYYKPQLIDNVQACMYALAFKKMYGFYPKRFIFIFSKHKKVRTIEITDEFIEAGTTNIKSIWYHIANGDFNPPPHAPKFFCNNFCQYKKICPRWKKPKGWEQVGEK